MKEYLQTKDEVLSRVSSTENGISTSEAQQRLIQNGKNILAADKKIPLYIRFLEQLKDPMIIILIVAAIVSGITAAYANESFADVIIIFAVVLINAILGVYQESKAEKAIESLQAMAASTSKVLRDGVIRIVKSEDIAVGDVVLLEAGDAVPADGRLLEAASLKIEEASLTGESVPVTKRVDTLALDGSKDIALGDRKNMVYMGSTVAYGRAKAVITGTGMNTEMGKIADALKKAEDGKTPLQLKLASLSKTLTYLVIGICAFIMIFSLVRAGDISGALVLDTFMVAVSLAVAAIPEGLATVVTIVLSIGVTNMSKRNAIIRKLTAVETLGCAQIICSDKTGTLTQNKMTVVEHYADDKALLCTAMALCSDAELDETGVSKGEPTECALVDFANISGYPKPELKLESPRIGEAPFDSGRKMMSTVHSAFGKIIQYTKGAPDEVISRCDYVIENGKKVSLTNEKRNEIMSVNKQYADKALRVLSAAFKLYSQETADYSPETLENSMIFIGLTGMIDPIRPEVYDAVQKCVNAGIKPVMITGDHKDTAVAIAMQLGIITSPSQAITGLELNDISDDAFKTSIEDYGVYARVQPEHKVRIVNAWRSKGYVTAMTGDGVNDAPSIKSADIGIGMGITGTDVTKNVADMVLADDNFATIVGAVEEGRRIYDNIRKAIQFLLASNMSEVLSIFVATLLGFTILKPVHLLWINLITDCFPALSLGMEKAEDNIMKRKPRDKSEGVFSGGLGKDILYQGVLVTILTIMAFFAGHLFETGSISLTNSEHGITMAFLTMSMAEVFHSFNMRSQRHSVFKLKTQNLFLWGAGVLSLLLTTIVIYIPFLSDAFGFTHVKFYEYITALVLAFLVIPIVETVKYFERKKTNNK